MKVLINMQSSSRPKHFQELAQLRETKDFIISETLKKQRENQSIFNQLESVTEDLKDLESLLSTLDRNSEDFKQLEPELKQLEDEVKRLETKKQEILEESERNRIKDLCSQIESIYESIESFSSSDFRNQKLEPFTNEENLLEMKKKIDLNKSKVLKNEEDLLKETQILENIQKDLISLMKMKLDKELEISILLKREENEQKMHDEQLERLNSLKKLQNSSINPDFHNKIQKKIELFSKSPSEVLKPEENHSKTLIFTALTLLALILLVYN
jgi:DNA repair exonuclease SbcCD ATPase subunit